MVVHVLQVEVAEVDLNLVLALTRDIILMVIQEKGINLIVGQVRVTSQVVIMTVTMDLVRLTVLVARIVRVQTLILAPNQVAVRAIQTVSLLQVTVLASQNRIQIQELNDSERSNFQSGAKVSDDETLKKYSKQNDDFSDDQAKSIFDNNDDYQTRDRYYRQDVIRNPWFWMYMSRRSYHRYGNSYHSKVNNKAYTKGYQDGFADAEKGIDNYDSYSKESTLFGKFTTTSEKTEYLRGYKDGHDDGK